jgi:thioredoxin 1
MNKKGFIIPIIIAVVAVAAIVGGVYIAQKPEKDTLSSDRMMEKEDVLPQEESMAKKSGSYEAYSPEKIALANTGKVVLFFHASWCPTCRTLDADIKANAHEIPNDVTILDIDYDNSTELKRKYGVTYQHTLVQVDGKGNMITKWAGSPTLASLSSNIK